MSNQAKKVNRTKRLKKARNMRHNNGVGRTALNVEMHNRVESGATGVNGGLFSSVANGLRRFAENAKKTITPAR